MWHAIKTTEENYFFKCSSQEENSITYYLYDLKEVWSEKCSITEIIQRSKNLNKRICYDSETVVATLRSGKPSSVSIESTDYGRNVILKYHIMERPFNFEWNLTPLHADEFQKLITNPLFLSIHYLAEQIKELKKIINKKDVEIKQYIAEGAVLQRKTVATEEFNEEAFNRPFSQVDEVSRGFLEISESIKGHFPLAEIKVIVTENNKEKTNRLTTFVSRDKTKKSPNKKRKLFESRNLKMSKIAKSKQKESLEYESSQSQSLSQTPPPLPSPPSPQDDVLAGIFQSLNELNAKRLASSLEVEKHDSL
ncbi:non-homologous end-joining factor 1-like [Eupeodes corollae]|uniref:non-homologous end-joining factor 1-like n=1 Tax=Eupeodes corollae TaxID=290404 RepID=UPI002493B5FC|nr:non-homologous end-joining factor 1-like [Eupeodes corollae]